MSTVLLFVTAPVPASLINTFLRTPNVLNLPNYQIFTLVHNPTQPFSSIDNPNTNPPIEADFSTGFLNTPDAALWQQHAQYYHESTRGRGTFLSNRIIVVMDTQSAARQDVVVLYKSVSRGFARWRVAFGDVASVDADLPRFEGAYFGDGVVREDGGLDLERVRELK